MVTSNVAGDEDAGAEKGSDASEAGKGKTEDKDFEFVEWDPTGRFGRVSGSPSLFYPHCFF
jgi:hypothetical protein